MWSIIFLGHCDQKLWHLLDFPKNSQKSDNFFLAKLSTQIIPRKSKQKYIKIS
jgi:hypothetical protein